MRREPDRELNRDELLELLLDRTKFLEWRKQNHDVHLDLRDVDLSRRDLSSFTFAPCDFSHANLRSAILSGAYFNGAVMTGVDLEYADLRGAKLIGTRLAEARLDNANLSVLPEPTANPGPDRSPSVPTEMALSILDGASLRGSNLTGANLCGASLNDAICNHARFEKANLRDVKAERTVFDKASLLEACLKNASLTGASFDEADLRNAQDIEFDQNSVVRARLSPNSRDAWPTLRRTYTGVKMVFMLMLLAAFLIPVSIRAFLFAEIGQFEKSLCDSIDQVTTCLVAMMPPNAPAEASRLVDDARRANRVLCEKLRSYRVWQLLVALDREWWASVAAGCLLVYNLFRAVLTWRVAPLKEEEDRSGVTPASRTLSGYRVLYLAHLGTKVLFWVALLAAAYHAYVLMRTPVFVLGP